MHNLHVNVEDLGLQYLSMGVMLKLNGVRNEKDIKVLLAERVLYFQKRVACYA